MSFARGSEIDIKKFTSMPVMADLFIQNNLPDGIFFISDIHSFIREALVEFDMFKNNGLDSNALIIGTVQSFPSAQEISYGILRRACDAVPRSERASRFIEAITQLPFCNQYIDDYGMVITDKAAHDIVQRMAIIIADYSDHVRSEVASRLNVLLNKYIHLYPYPNMKEAKIIFHLSHKSENTPAYQAMLMGLVSEPGLDFHARIRSCEYGNETLAHAIFKYGNLALFEWLLVSGHLYADAASRNEPYLVDLLSSRYRDVGVFVESLFRHGYQINDRDREELQDPRSLVLFNMKSEVRAVVSRYIDLPSRVQSSFVPSESDDDSEHGMDVDADMQRRLSF